MAVEQKNGQLLLAIFFTRILIMPAAPLFGLIHYRFNNQFNPAVKLAPLLGGIVRDRAVFAHTA